MVPGHQLGRMALSGYGDGAIFHPAKTVKETKQKKIKQNIYFPLRKAFSFPTFPHQSGQLIQDKVSLPVSDFFFHQLLWHRSDA